MPATSPSGKQYKKNIFVRSGVYEPFKGNVKKLVLPLSTGKNRAVKKHPYQVVVFERSRAVNGVLKFPVDPLREPPDDEIKRKTPSPSRGF